MDRVFGSGANDRITASGDDSITLYGRKGDDILISGTGDSFLRGGVGNDRLAAGEGDDRLSGHDGKDRLTGGDGDDLLNGGAGDDVLFGDSGDDRLVGGAGADRFLFREGSDRDKVFDFEVGIDTLVLDDNLWTGSLTAAEVMDTYGRHVGTGVVLDFGNGDYLRINNAQMDDILDDLLII